MIAIGSRESVIQILEDAGCETEMIRFGERQQEKDKIESSRKKEKRDERSDEDYA